MSGYSLECDEMHFSYGMFPIFTTGIKHKQSPIFLYLRV